MSTAKKIALRIWSIWCIMHFGLFFVVFLPVILLLIALNTRRSHQSVQRITRWWAHYLFFMMRIKVRSVNQDVVDVQDVYIFACNHTSYLDIPVCNYSIRNPLRFIGKAEVSKIPLFGYMFRKMHVPVIREKTVASFKSYVHATEKLSQGFSILIYPEATIPDKRKVDLLPFKSGAFRMAIENQVKLAPVVLLGAMECFPDNGKWFVYPGTVYVHYLPPVDTKGMTLDDADRLREQVREDMLKYLYAHGYQNLPA